MSNLLVGHNTDKPIDKLIEDIADKQTDCITNKKEKE
jgi:hypothetical protein